MNVKERFSEAVETAQATHEKIKSGRGTAADHPLLVRQMQEAKRLQVEFKAAKAGDAELAELNALGGTAPILVGTSGAVGQLRELHRAAVEGKSASVEVSTKALLGGPTLPATVSPYTSPGDFPTNAVELSSLFPTETMAGPVLRVYKIASQAVADIVTEGEVKPAAGIVTDAVDLTAVKFATTQPLTWEAMSDFPTLDSVVTGELMQAVRARVNKYIIATATAASGILSVTSASLIDGISQAKGLLVGLTGYLPTAVVCNPSDVASLVEQSKSVGSGEYFVSPLSGTPTSLHNVPLAVTPAMPAGSWLAGSFLTAGRFGWRETMHVQVGFSTGDFESNKRTIIVEARGVLGIVRANHLVTGKFV